MSRQTTTQADIQRAPTRSGGERARDGGEDHAEAPLQLMVGPGVGTTALSALMASGGNVQMAQLSHPVQRSADKGGADNDGEDKAGGDKGGEDKLRLVVSVLENKLGRELKGADVKVVRDQLKGREEEPTPELVRDLLPMLGGEAPVQQQATGGPVQRQAGGGEDTGAVHAAAARGIAGGGGSLPYAEQIQQSFGRHDVSGIKGHVGGPAREASEAMGAEAYATGDHVAFKGQPDLHTAAHEAAHVVQQRAGVSLKGGVGQVGDAYERHADAVADRVVQGKSAEDLLDTMAGGGGRNAAVQREKTNGASLDTSAIKEGKLGGAIATGRPFDLPVKFPTIPLGTPPIGFCKIGGSLGMTSKLGGTISPREGASVTAQVSVDAKLAMTIGLGVEQAHVAVEGALSLSCGSIAATATYRRSEWTGRVDIKRAAVSASLSINAKAGALGASWVLAKAPIGEYVALGYSSEGGWTLGQWIWSKEALAFFERAHRSKYKPSAIEQDLKAMMAESTPDYSSFLLTLAKNGGVSTSAHLETLRRVSRHKVAVRGLALDPKGDAFRQQLRATAPHGMQVLTTISNWR